MMNQFLSVYMLGVLFCGVTGCSRGGLQLPEDPVPEHREDGQSKNYDKNPAPVVVAAGGPVNSVPLFSKTIHLNEFSEAPLVEKPVFPLNGVWDAIGMLTGGNAPFQGLLLDAGFTLSLEFGGEVLTAHIVGPSTDVSSGCRMELVFSAVHSIMECGCSILTVHSFNENSENPPVDLNCAVASLSLSAQEVRSIFSNSLTSVFDMPFDADSSEGVVDLAVYGSSVGFLQLIRR